MEHIERRSVLSMQTLLPLAMVVTLCGACIALGQFLGTIANHEIRLSEIKQNTDRLETKMDGEVKNLKQDMTNLNSKVDQNFKELKNSIENINVILAKLATKLQVDVKDNLPKSTQDSVTYDPSSLF